MASPRASMPCLRAEPTTCSNAPATRHRCHRVPAERAAPLVVGAKLSILDVRCKDRSGTTFVVEMQLVTSRASSIVWSTTLQGLRGQLREADRYTQLTDVVAISICDFELWPDAAQRAKISRWCDAEPLEHDRAQVRQPRPAPVQYVFLELPKLPARSHRTGRRSVAWLFVHAPQLTAVRGLSPDRTGPRSSSRTRRRSRKASSTRTAG